ncbi:MAG TPA: cytochrome c biogenesis protein CcdA [Chloroflexota bacterium]|jgi:cytochrome c-type biogenesis protein|nr:cytochrome c biogenesis protein CcdA [Chloroflexota bacterium]
MIVADRLAGRVALQPTRRVVLVATLAVLLPLATWLVAGRLLAGVPSGTGAPAGQMAGLLALLQRNAYGPGGEAVEVIYAPPAYFALTNQSAESVAFGAEERLVFLLTESVHHGDLPAPLRPTLRIDGRRELSPVEATVLMDAVHHRTSIVAYEAGDPPTSSLELVLPGPAQGGPTTALRWDVPIGLERAVPPTPSGVLAGLTSASLLAALGGLLASMWPCLFQLTAYFIPSLAGLSMEQAGAPNPAMRRRVVATALYFVVGIVAVYTAAGALVGYVAGTFGGDVLAPYRRPLAVAAGLVIIAMAVRVAARARAPFVCHMPIVSLAGRGQPGPLGTVLLGLAFATGCMTCFGAALGLGMLTYTLASGSAVTGALTLLLFSLGIAVPLVGAAVAMAHVMPLLTRLERIAPTMALASSAVMIGFAFLLITDNYHVVSDFLASAVGIPRA